MRIIGTTDNLNADVSKVSKYTSLNLQTYKHYICTELSRHTNLDSEIDFWNLNSLTKIDVLNTYEKPVSANKTINYSLIVLNFWDGEKVALEVNSSEYDLLLVTQSIRKLYTDGKSYSKSKLENDLKNYILFLRESYIKSEIFYGCFGSIAAAWGFCLLFYPIAYDYFWIFGVFAVAIIIIGIGLNQNIDRKKLIKSDENSDFLNAEG